MGWLDTLPSGTLALMVALGAGLLIGLDRERRKGQGPGRHAAGLRTFVVAALAGAGAQLASPMLAAVALGSVSLLAALSYWRSRSDDPGLTTELALVTTTLIGVLAVSMPALAAGLAVVLACVLAARERLHRFATDWLREEELHDGLLLAALVLVLLPLLPAEPLAWLGRLSPQRVLMLVVVILALQAASHLGQRLLGARSGVALSGLLGGFVSSTATISALGAQARDGRLPMRVACCGAILSTAATWLQVLLMASVVAPSLLASLVGLVAAAAAAPLLAGLVLWRRGAPQGMSAPEGRRVLQPKAALLVAALLVAGAVLVNLAQQLGAAGVLVGTAVAAAMDAHAPLAALMSLWASARIEPHLAFQGVLVAIGVNSVSRTVVASVAGGRRFAMAVGLVMALSVLQAGAWVAWHA